MPLEMKKKRGQSRLMCESLGVHERQSKRSSYFEFDRAFYRDVQANLPEGQERYQDEYRAEEGGSAQAQKRLTR